MNYALIFCFSCILALSAYLGNEVLEPPIEYHLQAKSEELLKSKLMDGAHVKFDHLHAHITLEPQAHKHAALVTSIIEDLPGAYVEKVDLLPSKVITNSNPPKRLDPPTMSSISSLSVERDGPATYKISGLMSSDSFIKKLSEDLKKAFPNSTIIDLVLYDPEVAAPIWKKHGEQNIISFFKSTKGPTTMTYAKDRLHIRFTPDDQAHLASLKSALSSSLPSSHTLDIKPYTNVEPKKPSIPAAISVAESLNGTLIEVSGIINSEESLILIEEMLKNATPGAKIKNFVKISPDVVAPEWLTQLTDITPRHLQSVSQGLLSFNDKSIRISGSTKSKPYYDEIDALLKQYQSNGFDVKNYMVLDEAPPPPSAETKPTSSNKPATQDQVKKLQAQLAKHAVYFDSSSARINPDQLDTVKEIADIIKLSSDKSSQLLVGGYADKKGDASFNRDLSIKRSNSVISQLIQYGIPEKRLRVQFFGEDPKPDTNNTWKSRRVEIRVLPKI